MGKTVAQIVTENIINKLQQGKIPWVSGWYTEAPINWVTQKRYTGINRWLLDSGEYLTFKQIQNAGGTLRKGAKSSIVVYYTENVKSKKEDVDTESKTPVVHKVLRYYLVYNVNDVDGIEPRRKHKRKTVKENFDVEKAKVISITYLQREKIRLNSGGDKAFYSKRTDAITLPISEQFYNEAHYYSTLFHEIGHSTGAVHRLNRIGIVNDEATFGTPLYAEEELIAECTAAQLCAEVGIPENIGVTNTAAYIQNWLSVLKNDTSLVLKAAAKAEQAVNYIEGK